MGGPDNPLETMDTHTKIKLIELLQNFQIK